MYFIMLCLYIISLTTIMEQVREVSDLPLLTMDEHTHVKLAVNSIFVLYVKIMPASCCQLSYVY